MYHMRSAGPQLDRTVNAEESSRVFQVIHTPQVIHTRPAERCKNCTPSSIWLPGTFLSIKIKVALQVQVPNAAVCNA